MANDVTGSSPEGVDQGSPPEGASTDSPSDFGKAGDPPTQTVPYERLQEVINKNKNTMKGAEEQIAELKNQVARLQAQTQPQSGQPAVGSISLGPDIADWQSKASQAFREGDEGTFLQANHAMMQLTAQQMVNQTLEKVAEEQQKAQQQHQFQTTHQSFLDKMIQDFPDMADQNSAQYKNAVNIWKNDSTLSNGNPRGEYDAAAHAALMLARQGSPTNPGIRNAGTVQLLDGSTPVGSAPPQSDSSRLREEIGTSDGLKAFLEAGIKDGSILSKPPPI